MDRSQFDLLLQESPLLRSLLAEQLLACEEAAAILCEALSGQIDAARLQRDLLSLQQKAAVADSGPIRDRLLNAMRGRLPTG